MEKKESTASTELRKEIEFYEKGFSFTDIVPVIAKDIFGDDWLRIIKNRGMDQIKIFEHAKKDKMIPYELTLAAIRSEKAPSAALKSGYSLTLEVKHGNPDYNGTYKVMAVKGNDIIINEVFIETADGIYKDETKLSALYDKLFKEDEEETLKESKDFAENIINKLKDEKQRKSLERSKKAKIISTVFLGVATIIGIAAGIKLFKTTFKKD